jgi:integrase
LSVSIKVKKTQFKHLNGAYLSLITIDDELDMISASYFLQRYNNGASLKTLEREAKALRKFYAFTISRNIDFLTRFAKLERLYIGEIEELHAYLSIHMETGDLVSQGTFQHYFLTAQRFVEFLFNCYQSRATDPEKLQASSTTLESMKQSFKINKHSPHNGNTKERIGLTPELQVIFFAAIDPNEENVLNPFKSKRTRWRNYCLFLTLILGGNRKGETLSLKCRDFQLIGNTTAGKYFEIIKRDRTYDGYPRKEIPSVKTKGRKITLNSELANIFEYYITEIRPKFKNAKKNEYMFLSNRDGKPLHPNTPNQAIDKLSKHHPQLRDKLSPHILRNTFHDLLSTSLDDRFEGMGPIRKQQIKTTMQEYAGGWSAGSNMVAHYPKGSIQARVAELQSRIQSKILSEKLDD